MLLLGYVLVVATINLTRGEWLPCAAEGGRCSCGGGGGGLVQYGACDDDNHWRFVAVRLEPEETFIACTNLAFRSDPAPERVKMCRCDASPAPEASNSECDGLMRTFDGMIIEPVDFEGPRASLSDAARTASRAAWVELPARSSPSYPRKCASKLGLAPAKNSSRVTIFYGLTLIGDPVCHGFEIARTQLLSMRLAGLVPGAQFHVFATVIANSPIIQRSVRKNCGDANRTSTATVADLKALVNEFTEGLATFNVQFENEYEYPALHALWSHARRQRRDDDELLLYFHNKGVTHASDSKRPRLERERIPNHFSVRGYRTLEEMIVFRTFVGAWRYIPPIFDHFDQVEHLSIAPDTLGVGYYNFWWATPAWIRMHEEPTRPSELAQFERHYYEHWLGDTGIPEELQRDPLPCKHGFSIGACAAGFCSSPGAKSALHYLNYYVSDFAKEFDGLSQTLLTPPNPQ